MVARSFAISALLASATKAMAVFDLNRLPQMELLTVVQPEAASLSQMKLVQAAGVLEQWEKSPLLSSGKTKLLLTGFTTSDQACYNPPPEPFSSPHALSSSLDALIELFEQQKSPVTATIERPGLQSALLAITDKVNVGFSDPAKLPNVNRMVILATDSPSEFVAAGSKMKGDGTDTCASGPPDAAVVAKILKERDIILVVAAVGDDTVAAWKSYGSALSEEARNLYHVIQFKTFQMNLEEQKAAAAELMTQPDFQALVKYLEARFASQGAVLPKIESTTPPPHTGATTPVHGVHALATALTAASLATLL